MGYSACGRKRRKASHGYAACLNCFQACINSCMYSAWFCGARLCLAPRSFYMMLKGLRLGAGILSCAGCRWKRTGRRPLRRSSAEEERSGSRFRHELNAYWAKHKGRLTGRCCRLFATLNRIRSPHAAETRPASVACTGPRVPCATLAGFGRSRPCRSGSEHIPGSLARFSGLMYSIRVIQPPAERRANSRPDPLELEPRDYRSRPARIRILRVRR